MLKKTSIPGRSGKSKLDDARKHCPAPIGESRYEATMQSVSKKKGKAIPTMDPRKKVAKPAADGPYECTMAGKGGKKK